MVSESLIVGINAYIVAYVEQMEAKFITGAEPFLNWEQDEQLKTLGRQDCRSISNSL